MEPSALWSGSPASGGDEVGRPVRPTGLHWGSPTWIKAFSRRSRVEGWFGNLKNDSTEALSRGTFRVVGIRKTSIMLTVYAVETNLRLLRAWARRQYGTEDLLPLLTLHPFGSSASPAVTLPHSTADPTD